MVCAGSAIEFPAAANEDQFGKPVEFPCGGFKFRKPQENDIGEGEFFIEDMNGKPVNHRKFFDYLMQAECRTDLLGSDKTPVLLLNLCEGRFCPTFLAYRMGSQVDRIFAFRGEATEGITLQDLDGDGVVEIIGGDGRFHYLDYSGADSPYIPAVYCYRSGRYRDCTTSYPAFVREEMQPYEKSLLECMAVKDKCRYGEISAAFTVIYACRSLLGERVQARRWLAEHMPRSEFAVRRKLFRMIDRGLRERQRGDLVRKAFTETNDSAN
jgi:hypothetical protein